MGLAAGLAARLGSLKSLNIRRLILSLWNPSCGNANVTASAKKRLPKTTSHADFTDKRPEGMGK